MIKSKLLEAWICLRSGRVTLPYPFKPSETPEGFRGIPERDVEKCIGCGGCANVCPSRVYIVKDETKELGDVRVFTCYFDRCTYCGRCAEVCPEGAITMSREFETATPRREDLFRTYEIYMGTCGRCGRCFDLTVNPLDRLMEKGRRE